MNLAAERWFARLVGVVLIAAVVSPALGDPPRDDFPLSTYPMFTARRTTAWLHGAVAVFPEGHEEALSPSLICGSMEVMQAAQTVRQALAQRRARPLCEEIAVRVGADSSLAGATAVRVIGMKYEPIVWFGQVDPQPLERRQHARCPVRRDAP